jgi:hypothetical protein
MKLMTEAQRERLIKNGEESGANHVPVIKLFHPAAAATWLITEIIPDTDERLAFGLADLGQGWPELGYIDLHELAAYRGRLGLTIERDMHFRAMGKPISEFADDARAKGRIVV